MRHLGRQLVLVSLAACSCKGCEEANPLQDEVCLDPSRQTLQDGVCNELCPPGRRVSWRPVGTSTCQDFGQWTASRPNEEGGAGEEEGGETEGPPGLVEWWELVIDELPALGLDDVVTGALEASLGPDVEVDDFLEQLANIDLPAAEDAAVRALVEDAVATAEAIDPASVCVHVWTGAGDPVNPPPNTEPDCIVAGEATREELEAELADAFQSSIGMPGLTDLIDSAGSPAPVMIAVVDTAPRVSAGKGNAVHGQAIASIIEQVVCGSAKPGPCPHTVETFLGLPRVLADDGVSAELDPQGGYFGLQSDLTRGIQEAMNVWMQSSPEIRPNLVINLSVGWEPSCSASSVVVEPVVTRAVAEGALVLAASGNRRLGSCIEGPVAPAAWAHLVHAVTPVDDQLDELVTHRPGSNARIAAHGFMAVTSSGGTTLGPLSGSSVATAALSGIAALVWSYRPGWTADEVMDLLWTSGEGRADSVQADFYRGAGEAPTQRVVMACRALATALGVLDASPVPCRNPKRPDVRDLWGIEQIIVADVVELDIDGDATFDVMCPWCYGTELETKVAGSPPVPALPDPWGVPQPDNPPCSMCGISVKTSTGTATARLMRDDEYQSMELVSTTITLWDAAERSRVVQYDADVLPLEPDTFYFVTSDDLTNLDGQGSLPARAYVTMVLEEGSQPVSFGNEIPVWYDTVTPPTPSTP